MERPLVAGKHQIDIIGVYWLCTPYIVTAALFTTFRKSRRVIASMCEVNEDSDYFIAEALLMNEYLLFLIMVLWFYFLPDLNP